MHRRTLAVVAILVAFLAQGHAEARKPEDVFAGKILLSKKRFPTYAKSVRAYIQQLRKQSSDRFWEDEENKQWKIYFAAFWKKPLNDLEVTVKLFDVTSGRRLVEAYEQLLSQRGERAYLGTLELPRETGKYEANTRILMVVENRGRVLAQKTFFLQGKRKTYSGKVVFSEEETREGGGSGDDEE